MVVSRLILLDAWKLLVEVVLAIFFAVHVGQLVCVDTAAGGFAPTSLL